MKDDRTPVARITLLTLSMVALLLPVSAAHAQGTQPGVPPGWVVPTAPGLFPEPVLLKKLMNASDGSMTPGGDPKDGPYVDFGNMITGAGWISAGPGYRRHVLNDRALIDMSTALSWRLYGVAQGRFELPHVAHDRLTLGTQAMYQDLLQVNYFGLGDDSLKSDRSAFRFHNIDVLGYATVRTTSWLSVTGRFGRIDRPHLSTATGRSVTVPNTIDRFSEISAPGVLTQPAFLHGDVSIAADWRDHAGHPTRGGLYRATAAGYSDRDAGTYSFRRYEVEASQFVPLFTKNWVLALHGWEVFSDPSSGSVVPFYLMPSLGGQNTLRGYYDYRFHDTHMQSFNVESRWALFSHVDAAAFVDAGKVAPRAGDLDFKRLKRSYGAGLRVHNSTSTLARLDIGHSAEGWRVFFKLSDPLRRSAPASGRSAVVPFVP
jgi:hypothetical protein